jgi:hypothetical protein
MLIFGLVYLGRKLLLDCLDILDELQASLILVIQVLAGHLSVVSSPLLSVACLVLLVLLLLLLLLLGLLLRLLLRLLAVMLRGRALSKVLQEKNHQYLSIEEN